MRQWIYDAIGVVVLWAIAAMLAWAAANWIASPGDVPRVAASVRQARAGK